MFCTENHPFATVERFGYLAIFLVVALERHANLGFFMPGESLVLVGGFIAEQGMFPLPALIMVISLAAIVGDSIGYQMGRQLGWGWLMQYGERFWLRQERLDRADAFFVKHGGKAVFSSHFHQLLGSLMPFVAGSHRMAYLKFLFLLSLSPCNGATLRGTRPMSNNAGRP